MHVGEVCGGRFELHSLEGVGGMGSVYRGRDLETGADVAVKVLEVSGASVERFEREVAMLADLSRLHPAIVRFIGQGHARDGAPFLAMEWLEGVDLGERLKRGGVTLPQALTIARRVGGALGAAHARGVVHRDVKPSNLFLVGGDPGQVKILDFGLARSVLTTRRLTRTGTVLGTAGYMSPEQITGDRDIDARADVFALGCVVFECLVGQAAYPGERLMAVLARVVLEEPPRLRDHRPELSCELEEVLARAMARDRDDRYADGNAFVEALEELGEQVIDSPAPKISRVGALTIGEQRVLGVIALADDTVEQGDSMTSGLAEPKRSVVEEIVSDWSGELLELGLGTMLVVMRGRENALDLAHRAARCALEIHDALSETKVVLVTGFAEMSGRGPVGPVAERAAELLEVVAEQQATGLYVDATSAGMLESRFVVHGAGPLRTLEGEHVPGAGSRRLLGRATPCVGRRKELTFLEASYDECLDESGAQIVVVSAAAGVGKSRLRQELVERLSRRAAAPTVLFAQGDAVAAQSAFAVVAQLVRGWAGITDAVDEGARYTKLRAALTPLFREPELTRIAEFLGEIVHASNPLAPSPQLRAAQHDARLMREQVRAAFVEWIGALARRPLVIALEDLQWGDGPSVAYIERAVSAYLEGQILVLAFARPEVFEAFPGLWESVGCQHLMLRPLRARACERLVRAALPDADEGVVARSVARAGGNAFYLEELVRHVAEGGRHEDLPETVVAMAQSRLDGLDAEARQVLRAGSVFGRVFWSGGIEALLGESMSAEVQKTWLDMLVKREVLYEPATAAQEARFPGERELVFRHDLLRESAYARLTDADRALGHRLAGAWLESKGEHDPLVLAEHYARGGDARRAEVYFIDAARASLTGGYLQQALEITRRGVEGGATAGALGALRLIQAQVHTWNGDYDDANAAATEALALATAGAAPWLHALALLSYAGAFGGDPDALERAGELFRGYRGELLPIGPAGRACFTLLASILPTGQRERAFSLLERVEAASRDDPGRDLGFEGWSGLLRAHLALYGLLPIGEARPNVEQAIRCFEETNDLLALALAGWKLGWCQVELGQVEAALETSTAVVEQATAVGYVAAVQYAHHFRGLSLCLLGDTAAGRAELEGLLEEANIFLIGVSRVAMALSHWLDDDYEVAAAVADEVAQVFDFLPVVQAQALTVLAAAELAAGLYREAAGRCQKARELVDASSMTVTYDALLRWTHGRALQALGRDGEALALLQRASRWLDEQVASIRDDERAAFLNAPAVSRLRALIAEASEVA